MALPWSPNFVSFCIFRFLAGAAGIGLFMSGFVIGDLYSNLFVLIPGTGDAGLYQYIKSEHGSGRIDVCDI